MRLWDHWLDDRRPHLFVQSLEPGAQAKDLLAGSQLVQGAGFGGQLGTSGEDLAAAWTPDGSGVVFAATMNRTDWTHGDVVQVLWLVPAAGGEPRRLTQGKDDYDAGARVGGRARFPRADEQRTRVLDRAAAPTDPLPADHLAGGKPLGSEGRGQPLLL